MSPSFLFDWFVASVLVAAVASMCACVYVGGLWLRGVDAFGWWRPIGSIVVALAIVGGFVIARRQRARGDD